MLVNFETLLNFEKQNLCHEAPSKFTLSKDSQRQRPKENQIMAQPVEKIVETTTENPGWLLEFCKCKQFYYSW